MDENLNQNQVEIVRRRKFLIIMLAVCFIAGAIFFWNEIRELRPLGKAIFGIGYFIIYTGLFWFYCDLYRKSRGHHKPL